MRHILHIITGANHQPAAAVIDVQKAETGLQLTVFDIGSGEVNYDELLDNIFEADSVEVW